MENYLSAHHAVDYGEYYKLICPNCGYQEAYIYKSDIERWMKNPNYKIPIRCNRLKNCAYEGFVELEVNEQAIENLKAKIQVAHVRDDKNSFIKETGLKFLESLCAMARNINGHDVDIRGIQNDLLKQHNIVYWKQGWIELIDMRKSSFGDKYRSSNYKDREVIIPIYNLDGRLDRLLLRSFDKKLEKKEIQVKLHNDSSELWNIAAIKTEAKHIFITEGVYDALSIMQANKNVQAIALPGVKKFKKLLKVILDNYDICKDKIFIIAFDSDEAGQKYAEEFKTLLDEKNILNGKLNLKGNKDANEVLQKSTLQLQLMIRSAIQQTKGKD